MSNRVIFVVLVLLAGAVVVLFGFAPPPRVLVTEIDINAPTERVWTVLTDFEGYSAWNPFIRAAKGRAVPGQRLEIHPRVADGDHELWPKILEVTPGESFDWNGHMPIYFLPGWFDGRHYLRLERREGGTHLLHYEVLYGFDLWFRDVEQYRKNLVDMNRGLKLWLEKP